VSWSEGRGDGKELNRYSVGRRFMDRPMQLLPPPSKVNEQNTHNQQRILFLTDSIFFLLRFDRISDQVGIPLHSLGQKNLLHTLSIILR